MSDKQKDLIREVFLRNGFTIKAGADDLADYVYAAAHELLQAVHAVQVDPVAYLRIDQLRQAQRMGPMLGEIAASPRVDRVPVYAAPQPAEQQPDIAQLVEALERIMTWPDGGRHYGQSKIKVFAAEALAAHRKQGGDA